MNRKEAIEYLRESAEASCLHERVKLNECAALLADPWLPIDSREWEDGDEAILKIDRGEDGFQALHCFFSAQDGQWFDAHALHDSHVCSSTILGYRDLNLESE